MEEEQISIPNQQHAMTRLLQWSANPRGGNNLYGRVLNGCGLKPDPSISPPTIQVMLSKTGKYFLSWHPAWFEEQDGPMQYMLMVHEAAHLALLHLEQMAQLYLKVGHSRRFKTLYPVLQVAADMEVNDTALRGVLDERGGIFKVHQKQYIWPEDRGYPPEMTMIEYFNLLVNDLQKSGFDPDYDFEADVQQQLDDLQTSGNSSSGTGKKKNKGGKKGKGSGPGKKRGTSTESSSQDKQETSSGENPYPDWFQGLLNSQHPHVRSWLDMLDEMTDAEIERATDRAHREAVKIIRNAVDQTQKSRGTIPAQFKNAISKLLEDPTIPWQMVVRGMIKSELSSKIDESTVLPNPAFLELEDFEPFPGFQKDFAFNIAIGIDTSGSVSDDEFSDFMSEVFGILRLQEGVTARIIMFDAGLQYEKILTSEDDGKYNTRDVGYRYGYGGTSFEPFLRYICGDTSPELWVPNAVREQEIFRKPDLAILLTDGYAPVGPEENGPIPTHSPTCPLIWCLTSNGKEDPYMQPRVLRINR